MVMCHISGITRLCKWSEGRSVQSCMGSMMVNQKLSSKSAFFDFVDKCQQGCLLLRIAWCEKPKITKNYHLNPQIFSLGKKKGGSWTSGFFVFSWIFRYNFVYFYWHIFVMQEILHTWRERGRKCV